MIIVDTIKVKGKWMHLTGYPIEDLHKFAESINLNRRWFQNKEDEPHYDISITKLEIAKQKGAIQVNHSQIKYFMKIAYSGSGRGVYVETEKGERGIFYYKDREFIMEDKLPVYMLDDKLRPLLDKNNSQIKKFISSLKLKVIGYVD